MANPWMPGILDFSGSDFSGSDFSDADGDDQPDLDSEESDFEHDLEADCAAEYVEEAEDVCGNDMPHKVDDGLATNPNDVPLKPDDTLPVVNAQVNDTASGYVGEGPSVAAETDPLFRPNRGTPVWMKQGPPRTGGKKGDGGKQIPLGIQWPPWEPGLPVGFRKLKDSLEPKWVNSIRARQSVQPGRLTTLSCSKSCSIHRVPHCIRRHSENAYDPQIISIGPFHYKKRESQLQSMEEHKWRYLHDILEDHKELGLLERCLLVIKKLEKKARYCYSEKVDLGSDPFVEMLVLDGFFIIEFFRRSLKNKEYPDDPILKLGWLKRAIKMDLLLLENQIPFIVLESLCKEISSLEFDDFLTNQVRPFIFPTKKNSPKSTQQEKEKATKFQHLQHLLHYVHCLHLSNSVDTPNSKKEKKEKDDSPRFHLLRYVPGLHLPSVDEKPTRRKPQIIPNASRLQEAGIKFDDGPGSDIKFEKGVIKIPRLKVKDATKSVLLNLVAFEQCYRHCSSHFAGYTYFMDCLIDNSKDVQILCENGIINRWLSSDKEVAALFNKMGGEIILYDHDSNLLNVCKEINQYYGASWNAWRTSLKRNYFNNPWAIISVAAAIVLLLFTFSQTFFSAFPKFAAGN